MLNILDCTLRDGGYYNNWRFSQDIVISYLRAIAACSISYAELGFRFKTPDDSIGPFGQTSEELLKTLDLPLSVKYAVMINGKEYLLPKHNQIDKAISDNFVDSSSSPLSMVRVAINFDDAINMKPIVSKLKSQGYEIGLNLMQSSGKDQAAYVETASEIAEWNMVDALYFADSFGSMVPSDITKIIKYLKKGWNGPIGFHSHNNKGFALINSIQAIKDGVIFCDSTVTGMGRGAGNVTTESLLMELVDMDLIDIDLSLLQGTVSDFMKLKEQYGWGTNMHYQYAANNNIHPTFVQTLLDDNRYDQYQSLKILESLSLEESSSSFSSVSIKNTIYKNTQKKEGTWDPKGFLEDSEVLLVGGGKSVKKYKEQILEYINKKNLKVIFLNINNYLPQEIGIATIVSHEIRAFLDASFYDSLSHPLIIPMKGLGKLVKNYIKNIEIYDYGLNLVEGSMTIGAKSCELHNTIVAGYALAVCTRAEAKKIHLVGFDGFQKEDIRFQEMSELLQRYNNLDESIDLAALTPTLYPIKEELLDE